MIPIPRYMQNHVSNLQNFSLHFDYFSNWDEAANFKAKVDHHSNAAATITSHARDVLVSLHKRQSAALKSVYDKGGICLEIAAKLATPYVSGLGGCHPTETGFILDRNTGLPYIPASGIKGVLRLAHALNIAEQYPEKVRPCDGGYEIPDTEESLRKYFGDTDTGTDNSVRGQLVFLDAFPATVPTIKQDIMNPHFGGYYKGDNPPVETENPIPVMFMSVQDGVIFKFRVFVAPLANGTQVDNSFNDDDKKAIIAMFNRAGEELGFGAKTSVGYGRFSGISDSTESMAVEWRRLEEEKEGALFPWRKELRKLSGLSNWGDFRQKGIDNLVLQEHRDKAEVSQQIYERACSLRQQAKSSWEAARDMLLQEWFAPTTLVWPPVQLGETSGGQQTNDSAFELERIKGIGKWADYIIAPANIDLLGKNGLKHLRDKLKGWGCEDKNAKNDKKTEWERLKQHMNK